MEYTAPKGTIELLQSLFWICGCVLCVAATFRLFKSKTPQPPNETLASIAQDVQRRLDYLENENVKVWVKMESDRIECLTGASGLQADLSGISSKLNEVKDNVSLLRLTVDQIKKK